jgi:parafibromin
MASTDPILLLRTSIGTSNPPKLTTSSTPDTAAVNLVDTLLNATHLYFASTPAGPQCHDLSSRTRFISTTPAESPVDLRSIYFAWLQKDQTVPEYIAAASDLASQLPAGQTVRHLVFVERIDLLTWLEGASDESEYIKPLEGEDAGAAEAGAAAAAVPTVSGTGVGVTQQSGSGRPMKVIDARLQEIYNGERKMGDRNTVLRGIKPTVSFHPPLTHQGLANTFRISPTCVKQPRSF